MGLKEAECSHPRPAGGLPFPEPAVLMQSTFPLFSLLSLCLLVPAAGAPPAPEAPERERLTARLQLSYSRPAEFSPAAIRRPLVPPPAGTLAAARTRADQAPDDLEALWSLASIAEQRDEPDAEEIWQNLVRRLEPEVRRRPTDLRARERLVEAMVGADLGQRVVPHAQELVARAPDSWRSHLLAGDAFFRRAEYRWRVLVPLTRASGSAPDGLAGQLRSDLDFADAAYRRARDLAPAEAAPRAGRIALLLSRPIFAASLPADVLGGPRPPDLAAVRTELSDWMRKAAGTVSPLWHTALFLVTGSADPNANPGQQDGPLLAALDSACAAARPAPGEEVFLDEARGMVAWARLEWPAARGHFEAAHRRDPTRSTAREWLAAAEIASPDFRQPARRSDLVRRVRARLEAADSAPDRTLLGMLLAGENRATAVEAFRRSLELDVENPNARYNLAVVLLQRGDPVGEALHHLTLALQYDPDHREAAFALGVAWILEGRLEGARAHMERLKTLDSLDSGLARRIDAVLADLAPGGGCEGPG